MGLFSKVKNLFKKEEKEEIKEEIEEQEVLEDEFEENDIEESNNPEETDNVKEKTDNKEEKNYQEEDNKKEINDNVKDQKDVIKNDIKVEKKTKKEKKKETKSTLQLYDDGLSKTRDNFVNKLISLNNRTKKITEEYFEELEDILIMADIGVNTVLSFIERLKKRVKSENITDLNYLQEVIVDELFIIYVDNSILTNKIKFNENGPTVILFVGVNGVGKTTTIGKMALKLMNDGKKCMMVAGDTFRAGAIEQLEEWSKKVGCSFVKGKEGSDPSSVIYDGVKKAKEENVDVILIDTAGRLQNKVNLMKELEKMNKVIGSLIENAPQETLLVIDATTGQNGISQAKSFKEITNITGIVLTKLDGTAKGGIVLAIKEELDIPVKYIGLGEKATDLEPFDIEKYIYGLFKDMM